MINKKKIKKIAELGLIASIVEITPANKEKGRLRNLIEKLRDSGIKEIVKTDKLKPRELDNLQKRIEAFEKLVYWDKKQLHLITYVSSLACIVDYHRNDKLNELFFEIIDYYERQNKIPPACFWAGKINQEKWEKCWE